MSNQNKLPVTAGFISLDPDPDSIWEKAIFYYSNDHVGMLSHMNEVFHYLESADVANVLDVLSDMYFLSQTKEDPFPISKEKIDDFALLMKLFTSMNKIEMEFLKKYRIAHVTE